MEYRVALYGEIGFIYIEMPRLKPLLLPGGLLPQGRRVRGRRQHLVQLRPHHPQQRGQRHERAADGHKGRVSSEDCVINGFRRRMTNNVVFLAVLVDGHPLPGVVLHPAVPGQR